VKLDDHNVKRYMKAFVIGILFFWIVSSGCGPVATNEPIFTLRPTSTITPTDTLVPTYTPLPTNTATPTGTITPTLKPGAIDCIIINSKHSDRTTSYQWAEYTKSVISKTGYFSGTVTNVNTDGVVVLATSDQQCIFLLSKIPLERVIKINKEQYMEGYGAISAIDYDSSVVIHLDAYIDSLIIR
jgi:hypothetical protein